MPRQTNAEVSASGPGPSGSRAMRGTSLAWRAFAVNALILVIAYALYVVTPATISSPIAISELLVLTFAIVLSLFVNLMLLRRTFAPLERLTTLMRRVDPLEPGTRMELARADGEVALLTESFNEMLDRLEGERRASAARAVLAQERERMRVARELHDGLGQAMTGILLLADGLARTTSDGDRETLEEIREATRASLEEVRRIARDLRPEALEDLGLCRALEALIATHRAHTGIPTLESLPGDLPPMSLEQELVVYRIAQESLTNIARHAGARRVEVRLEVLDEGGTLRLEVCDDGKGFDPARADGGVLGMRERALLVKGHVSVRSSPGAGTTVVLTLPTSL